MNVEQEIQKRFTNVQRLNNEDEQERRRHNQTTGRIHSEINTNSQIEVERNGTNFKLSISFNRIGVSVVHDQKKTARYNSTATVVQTEKNVFSALGTSYYYPGQSRYLAREFKTTEFNRAIDQILQELSKDCVNRKLEASSDLYESLTYNKNEKYQMKNDVFIFVPAKNDEAYLIELKKDPVQGNQYYNYGTLTETRFSRFLLPEKTLGKISDFRLGRRDNSVCCRNAGGEVKISTLEKRNFWSVLHLTKNHQILQDSMGFIMEKLTVADLQTCAELVGDEEGWEEKGMMSYLATGAITPRFFGIQQWTGKNGTTQVFAVPVKERRRTKSGMKTTYFSGLETSTIDALKEPFERLRLEALPLLAYSNKVMDVLGD